MGHMSPIEIVPVEGRRDKKRFFHLPWKLYRDDPNWIPPLRSNQWELLGFGAWAIELRETGAYVGQVGLNLPADFPQRELGWLVWQEYEGKGYAIEAALRAREFAYQTLGWNTLVSYIDPDNARSIRLAERMGAAPDPHAPTPNSEPCLVYRHPSPSASMG